MTNQNSAFACIGEIVWASPHRKVGKHEWRLTIYRINKRRYLGYEWRRAPQTIMGEDFPSGPYWRQDVDWPKYNSNDGMWAGLPKSLLKLYNDTQDKREEMENGRRSAKAAEVTP